MAFADELHGTFTDRGIFGGSVPFGPLSRMALGTDLPRGSMSWNGTPCVVFGPHSEKTSRSGPLSLPSWNIPFVVMTVAALFSGSGKYLPRAVRNSSRLTT